MKDNLVPLELAERGKPRLGFTLYADIDPLPRKSWLVRDFLGEGEMSCIFGPPGSGKSVLAGDLAAHIAAGKDWHGRRVEQGGVLYVAAERGALVKRRFAAFRLYHHLDDLPLAIVTGPADLRSSHADADLIISYAERLGSVRLIIIDTIARVMAGGDENAPKDMGSLIGNLGRIGDATGAHVCVIHHIPADGSQRLRGHGALLGACDVTVKVEKAGAIRVATTDKVNDGPDGERVVFDLTSVDLHHDLETDITTTAPVVISAEGGPAERTASGKLSNAAAIALDGLREAIAAAGTSPPASNHIPAGVRVTTIETWRTYSYRRGISSSTEPRAQQQAFKRGYEALVAARRVAVWEPYVWVC